MLEITLFSNKTQNDTNKYLFVIIFAVITWILQITLINRLLFFDTAPNLILLSCVLLGLKLGPTLGAFFGIISSFLSSCILYDHVFYISYPFIGFLAGLLTKNLFSDELLFFSMLCFLLSIPFELLNGLQYGQKNLIVFTNRYILVSLTSSIINLCFSYVFYFITHIVTKKLNYRLDH